MKKFYCLLLIFLLISCSTTNESTQIAETPETTTTVSNIESNADTTCLLYTSDAADED